LGLGLYELLPDYRDRCPLCRGADCAVRHGLYFRSLVDLDSCLYERFPVARFRCRRRGPQQPQDVTFSVLPAQVVARRRFSLPLMSWIVDLLGTGQSTFRQALDTLAALSQQENDALLVQELSLYRTLLLFCAVYARLLSFPLERLELQVGLTGVRSQALQVTQVLAGEPRGSPSRLVLDFHQHYFPHLLFDLRLKNGSVRPRSSQ